LLKTAIAPTPTIFEGTTIDSNILFDEGSQRSFISQDLSSKLGLQPYDRESILLSSFGAEVPSYRALDTATITVQTITREKIPIFVFIVPKMIFHCQTQYISHLNSFFILEGFNLDHPVTENENFEISLLVGADYCWHFVGDHVIHGNGRIAVQSKLDYLLSGPIPSATHVSTTLVHLLHVNATSNVTTCNLEKFWQVDTVGVTTPLQTTTDQQFLKSYINSCVTPQPDGSYSVKFPWKQQHPQLPLNYTICEKRTRDDWQQTPNYYKHISEQS